MIPRRQQPSSRCRPGPGIDSSFGRSGEEFGHWRSREPRGFGQGVLQFNAYVRNPPFALAALGAPGTAVACSQRKGGTAPLRALEAILRPWEGHSPWSASTLRAHGAASRRAQAKGRLSQDTGWWSHRAQAQAEASRGQASSPLPSARTSRVSTPAETVEDSTDVDTSCRPAFVSIQV